MKTYFKINEVSQLYGISIDSLRYYEEIGLLSPKRGENKYRYYSFNDLMRLNIIREFRNLNFSFTAIKDIMENRSLQSTISLLEKESEAIDEEIRILKQKKKNIRQRIHNINTFSSGMPLNQVFIKELPAFKCLHITDDDIHQDCIDFYVSSYIHEKNIDVSNFIGRYDLYRLDVSAPLSDSYYRVKEVLIANNSMHVSPDYILPGGPYLILNYNTDIENTRSHVDRLLSYADSHHIRLTDDIFEACIFDLYDTSDPSEYLTSIWARIDF